MLRTVPRKKPHLSSHWPPGARNRSTEKLETRGPPIWRPASLLPSCSQFWHGPPQPSLKLQQFESRSLRDLNQALISKRASLADGLALRLPGLRRLVESGKDSGAPVRLLLAALDRARSSTDVNRSTSTLRCGCFNISS